MEIIAEIGGNFESFDDCKAAIIGAWRANATAVKFQMFSEQELYGFGSEQRKFDPKWLPKLSSLAHKYKMRFGCTAFSQEGVDIVSPYVDFYKVASAENRMEFDFPRAIPRIFSTGGSNFNELALIVERNQLTEHDCLMYCVPCYPADYTDYFFENIVTLGQLFPTKLGISDHTTGIELAQNCAAPWYGVEYYEKHFRPMATRETSPDYGHSVPGNVFSRMVTALTNRDTLLHAATMGEAEFKEKHKRRWIEIDGVNKFVRPKP